MAFEYALISKVKTLAGAFGQDALLQFHKLMGMLATALLAIHVFLMVYAAGYPIEWLNPFHEESPWAMRWGIISTAFLVLLMFLSMGRKMIRLSYDWWQLTHAWLADAIILAGLVHVLQFGTFSSSPAMQVAFTVYYAILLALGINFKIIRPLRMWSKPWEVVENRKERGDSRTLVLKPVGHDGFTFEPGQFAWISTGKTPFHKDRHPISFSSCAYDHMPAEIGFTIRDLGDWSGGTVPDLEPGRRVWVDGPHGVFTADREQGMGYVLIGGGVGITPMMSICATLAERGDTRPVILFFASRDVEGLTFAEEFEALKNRMNLRIVIVIERPPDGWTGEKGYLTGEMMKKHLPAHFRRFQYFICGPVPMMNAVEKALPRLGVPPQHIHSERFDMV
ncbi:MAG: ferredoxin reductase family protein [Bryobacterales bacterium]|nr:ferredoxin reductase family protein [Bryobacterales bacterium]